MTELLPLLDEYLATRRAFGARLVGAERMLRNFLTFLRQRQVACITTQLALRWATRAQPHAACPPSAATGGRARVRTLCARG